jgi:V-type H+-transporting ATPase subunit H
MSGAEILEKYSDAAAAGGAATEKMVKPNYSSYQKLAPHAAALNGLEVGGNSTFSAETVKGVSASLSETDAAKYVLTAVYDLLRADSSAFGAFQEAVKSDGQALAPMGAFLGSCQDSYLADKCAWILTAVLAHLSKNCDPSGSLTASLWQSKCSDLGKLEATTNLLKSELYRSGWCSQAVQDLVSRGLSSKNSAMAYKGVFAIWMVSFDTSDAVVKSLSSFNVVAKLKNILSDCRTEKVIRLGLTVLRNFLSNKSAFKEINEAIVEEGLADVVQGLEYEKWRDTELYDEIRDVCQMISTEVKEKSNFNRYMKELESGNLSWGFIHSPKFFGENIMKFSTNDFKAVKQLANLVAQDGNNTTLAVACHDIGQFVALHPDGKREVARLGVKERVMDLMASSDADMREVRREALLCCQKIMLNKWQDAAAK